MPTWKWLTAHSDLDSLLIKEKQEKPNTHTHACTLYVQFKENTEHMKKKLQKSNSTRTLTIYYHTTSKTME